MGDEAASAFDEHRMPTLVNVTGNVCAPLSAAVNR